MSRHWQFPIERGSILAFARSVGDTNPIYFDEEYAASSEIGHVIAPPTYVVSSAHFDEDYPFRPEVDVARSPRLAPNSANDMNQRLHAEQHFEYHRIISPGQVLNVSETQGDSWERRGSGGARLRFSESVARYYTESGDLAVTSRRVVVRTDRPIEGT